MAAPYPTNYTVQDLTSLPTLARLAILNGHEAGNGGDDLTNAEPVLY
jgi:hypothetical protein